MHRSSFPLIRDLEYAILTGFFLVILILVPVCGAEVSIGTIIDTVGMVDDHTTVVMGAGTLGINGSAMLYRDSSISNGGTMQLNKIVGPGNGDGSTGSIVAQKVLSYDAAGTGSHIATSENSITSSTGNQSTGSTPVCSFASTGSGGINRSISTSASLDIINANTLQLTSSTRITPGDLMYSVTANTSPASGNHSDPATIVSSFTYEDQTVEGVNRAADRSMVSGLFDLFNRVYHGGNGARIQAQTQTSAMVSSKTVAEQTYTQINVSNQRPEWRGSAVYAADLMTNGGTLDETRTLSSENTITSQRVLTYLGNGSTSMQTEERIVAIKEVPPGNGSTSAVGCVFAGGEPNSTASSLSQSVAASSQVFGVDSAQVSSTAQIDVGSGGNGTTPLKVDYKAGITSPVQFDARIIQVMTDPDKDGKYEDLNGNGRQDMQDLVLLFKNFE
ncbi:MAG: hypothetical protein CVV33_00120, partial [Methanomicrobiales archaeon HGW-Methanomicrobiales-4]